MSDEKDVGVEHKKKEIEVKDNAKLEEVLRGYRILYFDEKHFLAKQFKINSIRIYDKSVLSISRYGDEMFTRTKNKLQKDSNMLTQQEQLRILTERGLWSTEREEELVALRQQAQNIIEEKSDVESLISELSGEKKKDSDKSKKLQVRLEKIGKEWIDVYSKYMEVVALNDTYFRDTIESQAETSQRKGWIVSCVCKHLNGDDKPLPEGYDSETCLWKNIEDFEKYMKGDGLVSMMTECMDYWESRDEGESFFVESPEDLKYGSDGDMVKTTEPDSTPAPSTDLNSPTSN